MKLTINFWDNGFEKVSIQYIDTTTDHITPCSRMRARGNKQISRLNRHLYSMKLKGPTFKCTKGPLPQHCNRPRMCACAQSSAVGMKDSIINEQHYRSASSNPPPANYRCGAGSRYGTAWLCFILGGFILQGEFVGGFCEAVLKT